MKKVWRLKTGKKWVGTYIRVGGEREFHLTPEGGGKHKAFESPQAAKKEGWKAS